MYITKIIKISSLRYVAHSRRSLGSFEKYSSRNFLQGKLYLKFSVALVQTLLASECWLLVDYTVNLQAAHVLLRTSPGSFLTSRSFLVCSTNIRFHQFSVYYCRSVPTLNKSPKLSTRMLWEIWDLAQTLVVGIIVLRHENNGILLDVTIAGPESSPYEAKIFKLGPSLPESILCSH